MGRTVEALEGLALLGRTTLAGASLPLPLLLESGDESDDERAVRLSSVESAPGTRHLRWRGPGLELDLAFPIPTPEITGPPAPWLAAGPEALVVRPPLARDAPPVPALPAGLLVFANARTLWSEGEPFVQAIGEIRRVFGAEPALWAPRVALPHRVPLLVYLGVDVVDSTEGRLAAAGGAYLEPTFGRFDRENARRESLCTCPACRPDGDGSPALHAAETYRRAVRETRAALRSGRLRQLVEARLASEPALAEMLRYADRHLGPQFEERTPVTGQGSQDYVLLESFRRPEMVRFRRRLLERYAPPPSKRLLLLVPCSRTKPYRLSRSHRRIWSAVEGVPGLERVHVVAVSSPIGIVPRELEDVFPARHYDIPVTGDWEDRERAAVADGVRHLLANGRYAAILAHLDPVEYGYLREVLAGAPVSWTSPEGRTTSTAALEALREAVSDGLRGMPAVDGGPLAVVREELRALAGVQFGPVGAERLFAGGIRLAGRPWFQRLTDGRTDLATLREERGLFYLTVEGARRMFPDPPLSVEVDPSLELTGDLFVPGVKAADPQIRIGDSVVLTRDRELAGVGEAALPGRMMRELRRGVAVRVRHRAHSAAR